jgi:hypothetical protein
MKAQRRRRMSPTERQIAKYKKAMSAKQEKLTKCGIDFALFESTD